VSLKGQFKQQSPFFATLAGASLLFALSGCSTVTTNQYEATARTTLTWKVGYSTNPGRNQERIETFASTSLLNRNGEKPEGAVIGPDERELWWPALPPRPTLDEIEQRLQPAEKASQPEILRDVNYQITYRSNGQSITLPTNYDVYREVVKAYPSQTPLELTLGVNDSSVEKAEPKEEN
jgi:hypothetical protein